MDNFTFIKRVFLKPQLLHNTKTTRKDSRNIPCLLKFNYTNSKQPVIVFMSPNTATELSISWSHRLEPEAKTRNKTPKIKFMVQFFFFTPTVKNPHLWSHSHMARGSGFLVGWNHLPIWGFFRLRLVLMTAAGTSPLAKQVVRFCKCRHFHLPRIQRNGTAWFKKTKLFDCVGLFRSPRMLKETEAKNNWTRTKAIAFTNSSKDS